ncbi:MAG: EamA family transporter [Candidatus Wildermuthbacteria bacterium]|nr:EamA family transporter [Candidatus Wildermuthbacteria bacterium]
MPNYILLSFLAAVSFAIVGILTKYASKHAIKERWPLLFYYYATFFPFVFLIPLFAKVQIPTGSWTILFLFSLFLFLGNICFSTAIFKTDASVFESFFQLQTAFIAILAFVFLGERFPLINYLWIGLILVGAILVSLDERLTLKTFFRRAVFLIILMQFLYAVSNLSAGFALKAMDFWNLTFWSTLVSASLIFTFVPILAKFKLKVSFNQVKPLFVMNLFSFIGATSLFAAFQTNLTISSAISFLTAPIVLFISMILSKFKPEFIEHHTGKVYVIRAIAVAIILFGALKISFGG